MTIISPRVQPPVRRLDRDGPSALPRDARLSLYRSMLKIRRVEERIQALYSQGDMRCPTHFSIGQEAVAAGVCGNLRLEDYVISAHRSHAHYIGKGGNLRAMFAELYGKVDGCASGKGGSMHLIDLSVNFLGCVPIVGSTIPIGVGASFGAMLQDRPALTVIFFGDAATETGVFHESVNFAAVHRLPVLFVCENNLYSVNTPLDVRQPGNRTIAELAARPRHQDLAARRPAGRDGRCGGRRDHRAYPRPGRPRAARIHHLPLARTLRPARATSILDTARQQEFDSWVAPLPDPAASPAAAGRGPHRRGRARRNGCRDRRRDRRRRRRSRRKARFRRAGSSAGTCSPDRSRVMSNRQLKFAEAIHEALDICLERDRSTYVMGLGVPDPIGVFGTTKGLQEKYGPRACVRHAGRRERHDRRRARLVPRRDAADHDPHAARIRHDRDGPDLQSGRQVALHVRRAVQGAADDPHAGRPRLGAGAATFAEPARLVRARSGPQGGHAVDAARRQGAADRQHRGRQSGRLLRASLAAQSCMGRCPRATTRSRSASRGS